jgi:hypothetical protein
VKLEKNLGAAITEKKKKELVTKSFSSQQKREENWPYYQ